MSRRPTALAASALSCLLLATLPATASEAASGSGPRPGAAGIGDRLYPTLGNGGYDALHYNLDLRYATTAPEQGIDGTVTMRARATQALSRFNLDFSGLGVGSVRVNGRAARFARVGEDLVITPARSIRKGTRFTVQVKHFTANPTVPNGDDLLSTAFFVTRDGSATSGQPNAMHTVFPSNDHPRDKASFSFRFDVPAGKTAVANGVLTGKKTRHGRSIWTYQQRQPMATELTQLVVGDFTFLKRPPVRGVAVRDVVPTRLAGEYKDKLAVERQQLTWMNKKVGAYPFDLYGSLVVDTSLGFALETQTLSLYDTPWFTNYPQGLWDPVMLHELAHQWFGDSVAPREWSDVWLNEGHASWYEYTYAEDKGFLPVNAGFTTVDDFMRAVYEAGDIYRQNFGPVARPLSGDVYDVFNSNVYEGGALVLYALRQKIGDRAFGQLERAWVQKYKGKSASTANFIALASRVSGKNLNGFLRSWLYSTTTPPMPGHADWKVSPAEPSAKAASADSAVKAATELATRLQANRRH
jgi:aminopeptidase N